jgi:hypothetical protein
MQCHVQVVVRSLGSISERSGKACSFFYIIYLFIILFSLALQPSVSYGLLVHEVLDLTQRRATVGKILSVCGQYEVELTG